MLTLTSIRIRNFRAIKELTFKPKEEGITGIFGQNGAGKTSILTAVMFALYGVRPKGINVTALRRIGSDKEECSVSVVFKHLGQQVEIIRELKGSANRVVVNIYVDGQAETVTSVGAADKWVTKRLGIDAEGFLTAFVVRQKELDAFVQALPSERKKIIEKLAGVETINNALKAAREDEKDSRKTVDILPGSQDQVDAAGADVDYFSDEAEKAASSLSLTRASLEAINEERTELFKTIQTLRDSATAVERLNNKIAQLESEIPDLESQINRVAYVTEISAEDDVQSLRDRYKEISDKVNSLREKQAHMAHQLKQATARKQELSAKLEQATTEITRVQSAYAGITLETLQNEINDNIQLQGDNKVRIGQLTSQNSELEESVRMLEGTADCPTCQTHLSNPEALISQFKATVEANKKEVQNLKDSIDNLRNRHVELSGDLNSLIRVSTLEESVTKYNDELGQIDTMLSEMPDFSKLETELANGAKEQERIIELGSKAKTLNADRTLHASLVERRETALQELAEVKASQEKGDKGFKPKALEDAQKKLDSINTDFERLSRDINGFTAQHTEAKVRFQTAKSTYTRAYEQWEKKKKLQEAHASKTLTTDMLEKFRQETVSSIAPELSDNATELISAMTNGDFTEIKLDDDFSASLVDAQGIERPVAWLSGGEESAVALALRLGVASLITGGTPELLWLDEPLTAQDKDRRASILSMIRSLPTNQILLINHAQEAQDIVDYEITLKKSDD
jgi:exonuclease SbcC